MASYINPASTSKTLALFLATDSDSSGVYGHVFDDPEYQAGDSLHSISNPESGFETGLYHHVSAYRSMFTDRVSKHTRMAAVVSVRHSRRQLGLDDSCHLYRSEHGAGRSGAAIADALSIISNETRWQDIQKLVIIPVNRLPVQPDTLDQLCRFGNGKSLVVPYCQGQPGFPVVVGRALWPQLMLFPGDNLIERLVANAPGNLVKLNVNDSRTLDTPPGLYRSA